MPKEKYKRGKKRKFREIKKEGLHTGFDDDNDDDNDDNNNNNMDVPSKKVKVQKKKEVREIPTVRHISNLSESQKSQLYTLFHANNDNNNNNNNNNNLILQKTVDYLWNIGICCVCIDRIISLGKSLNSNNNNNNNDNGDAIMKDKDKDKDASKKEDNMFNPSFFQHILACIELNRQLTTTTTIDTATTTTTTPTTTTTTTTDAISTNNDTCMDVDHKEESLQKQFVVSSLPSIDEYYCYICNGTYIRILDLLPTWYKDITTYEFDEYFTSICVPFWHILRDFYVITHLQNFVEGCNILLPEKDYNPHIVYLRTLINQYFWQQKEEGKEEIKREWNWDPESLFKIEIKIFNDAIEKIEKPSQLIEGIAMSGNSNISEEKKENPDNEKSKNFVQKVQQRKKKPDKWIWPELYFIRLFLKPSDESTYARHAPFLTGNPTHFFYANYEKLHDILIHINSHYYLSWIFLAYGTDDYTYDTSYRVIRPSVYLKCKYFKYDRQMSQTPSAYSSASVALIILNIFKSFRFLNDNGKLWCECAYALLHGGGREDRDVRMLGEGRPCIFEFVHPRRNIKKMFDKNKNLVEEIQKFVNSDQVYNKGRIAIRGLGIASVSDFEHLKHAAQTKRKSYRCVCWLSEPISPEIFDQKLEEIQTTIDVNEGLTIEQTTPIRVLSRRAPIVRERKIYELKGTWINAHWCYIDVTTQAGTYIKEFIHGDRGRTTPNLASLFEVEDAQIIQLDVTGVYG